MRLPLAVLGPLGLVVLHERVDAPAVQFVRAGWHRLQVLALQEGEGLLECRAERVVDGCAREVIGDHDGRPVAFYFFAYGFVGFGSSPAPGTRAAHSSPRFTISFASGTSKSAAECPSVELKTRPLPYSFFHTTGITAP